MSTFLSMFFLQCGSLSHLPSSPVFLWPQALFFGAFASQRRAKDSDPPIQANFYSILFCIFIHRQLLPISSLPPTHSIPSGPTITVFSHLENSLTEFWVAGIEQTSIQMLLSKTAPT